MSDVVSGGINFGQCNGFTIDVCPVKDIPTCKLVEELQRREGVDATTIDPYEHFKVDCEGPAIVLIVTD